MAAKLPEYNAFLRNWDSAKIVHISGTGMGGDGKHFPRIGTYSRKPMPDAREYIYVKLRSQLITNARTTNRNTIMSETRHVEQNQNKYHASQNHRRTSQIRNQNYSQEEHNLHNTKQSKNVEATTTSKHDINQKTNQSAKGAQRLRLNVLAKRF